METIKDFLSAPSEKEAAFWESETLIWIDWREYDEDIIRYLNEKIPAADQIDFECAGTDKARGIDLILKKDGIDLPVPYADDRTDRDTTLQSAQAYVAPKYQIRCYVASLCGDTLGFCILPSAQWRQLEEAFGADQVARYFLPVQAGRSFFEMDMEEISARLKEIGPA